MRKDEFDRSIEFLDDCQPGIFADKKLWKMKKERLILLLQKERNKTKSHNMTMKIYRNTK